MNVLSSADKYCCNDGTDNGTAITKKLDTMFVCDFCCGLFASVGYLDKHKECCNIPQDQANFHEETNSQVSEMFYVNLM